MSHSPRGSHEREIRPVKWPLALGAVLVGADWPDTASLQDL